MNLVKHTVSYRVIVPFNADSYLQHYHKSERVAFRNAERTLKHTAGVKVVRVTTTTYKDEINLPKTP